MKKGYKKPQVTEVKLTVMKPILGGCATTGLSSEQLTCQGTGCQSA